MKKYDLIGLIIGSTVGILFSLFLYNPPRIDLLSILLEVFLPLMVGGYVTGLWIKMWKIAKEKAKGEKPFRQIKSIKELNIDQKNLLIKMVKLQRKCCLFFIFLFFWTLIMWLPLKYEVIIIYPIISIISTLMGIFFVVKIFFPLRKVQFELRAKGLSTFPKYLPAYKIGFTFLLIGEIFLVILFFWCVFSENYEFTLLIVSLSFLYMGISGYIISKKNEKALLKDETMNSS